MLSDAAGLRSCGRCFTAGLDLKTSGSGRQQTADCGRGAAASVGERKCGSWQSHGGRAVQTETVQRQTQTQGPYSRVGGQQLVGRLLYSISSY